MKLQMTLFHHMKVHIKVQKRLQVRVHEAWDPSSFHLDQSEIQADHVCILCRLDDWTCPDLRPWRILHNGAETSWPGPRT